MREYGQIQCAFWQSEDAGKLSDAGKLLAAYLMTGPHSNGLGAYRCSNGYVADDLGWGVEKAEQVFAELSSIGFAYRHNNIVVMPAFLRWNKTANPNVVKNRMQELAAIPKGEAKRKAAEGFLRWGKHMSDAVVEELQAIAATVDETVSVAPVKPFPNTPAPPDQPLPPTPTPPKARKSARPPVGGEEFSPGFLAFWEAYPTQKRSKRLEAWRTWQSDKLEEFTNTIVRDVERRKVEHWPWIKDGGQFIPGAQVYLNGRRWNDAIELRHRVGRREGNEQDNNQRAQDWADNALS